MVAVALLSNPRSTGNRAQLPRVRAFCADHPEIFHYEVEHVDQIAAAFRSIALVKPRVIAINGGDGTVQAALTELYSGNHFNGNPPPVAVLPNGKTNLIALDLGAEGDPLEALAKVTQLAQTDVAPHVIQRQLISLSEAGSNRPVLGMFLGGAGLADTILYTRNKIYPLGLPNGVSHVIAAFATIIAMLLHVGGRILPPRPNPVRVSVSRDGVIKGRFSLLIVTTLEKMLFNFQPGDGDGTENSGRMKMLAVDQGVGTLIRMFAASFRGSLEKRQVPGVHFEQGDVIQIDSDRSSVILDGELFEARKGQPITLTSTRPVPFLRLAA